MKATEARQSERFRIARELHDDILQQLALVQMGLDQLKASSALTVDTAAKVDALSVRTGEAIRAIRSLVYDLHPPSANGPRLDHLMWERCSALGEQLHLAIDFTHRALPENVSTEHTDCLLHVVQEALVNVARHSGSRRASVRLWGSPGTAAAVHLTVRDFGSGFNVQDTRRGIGLSAMHERVAAIQGMLWISSKPGVTPGATVAVRLPLILGA